MPIRFYALLVQYGPKKSPTYCLRGKIWGIFCSATINRALQFRIRPNRSTSHSTISLFCNNGVSGSSFDHLNYGLMEITALTAQVHSIVRERWLNGDKFIILSMEEVENIVLEGRTCFLNRGYAKLAELMNRNFDLRM